MFRSRSHETHARNSEILFRCEWQRGQTEKARRRKPTGFEKRSSVHECCSEGGMPAILFRSAGECKRQLVIGINEAVSSAVFGLIKRDPDRFSSLIQTKRSVRLLPLHQHAQGKAPQRWRQPSCEPHTPRSNHTHFRRRVTQNRILPDGKLISTTRLQHVRSIADHPPPFVLHAQIVGAQIDQQGRLEGLGSPEEKREFHRNQNLEIVQRILYLRPKSSHRISGKSSRQERLTPVSAVRTREHPNYPRSRRVVDYVFRIDRIRRRWRWRHLGKRANRERDSRGGSGKRKPGSDAWPRAPISRPKTLPQRAL